MNSIGTDQNKPIMIRFLQAQNVAYDQAKRVQFIEMWSQVFSLVVVVLGICLSSKIYEQYVTVITLVFIIINGATYIHGKNKTDQAANIQEQFDIDLFTLNWNQTLCGRRVSLNEIIKLSKQCKNNKLLDWYSTEIKPNILHVNAVLLCQDANLNWDINLRKKFKNHILLFSIIFYTLFFVYLFKVDKSIVQSVILLSPTLSFLLFSFVTISNVNDLITEKTNLSDLIKDYFENYKNTGVIASNESLREIQNGIYTNRKKSEKIPTWYNNLYRNKQQNDMDECTRLLIQQYGL